MITEFEIVSAASPFPTASRTYTHDGIFHKRPSACKFCKTHSCRDSIGETFGHHTCEFGLSFYPVGSAETQGLIIGLIVTDRNFVVSGDRRKDLSYNWVEHKSVEIFNQRLKGILEKISEFGVTQTQTSLAFLHEIRSTVGVVLNNSEAMIQKSPGSDLSEKIGNADKELRNLLQSISLLKEQLELTDVIANPDSITYGRRYRSEINGLFFKMVKLFEGRASKRGINIKFHGASEWYFQVYHSFQLVPLILLDNAIKYSFSNRTIYVQISETIRHLEIRVSSFGTSVPHDYREKIFEKFVRGPEAQKQSAEGMGLGLFVARQILVEHGFEISYETNAEDNHPANNDFVVRIPIEEIEHGKK